MIPSRRRRIVGNWKMWGSQAHLAELDAIDAAARAHRKVDVVLCLPFTMIERASRSCSALAIGAQDCHAAAGGAHTGDVSAAMLRESGASWAIVGHSERRAEHFETDAIVRAKAEAAIDARLGVFLCVGESASQRQAGQAEHAVLTQLGNSFPRNAAADSTFVAYEPLWAIGAAQTPSPEQIASMHCAIRRRLGDWDVNVLYGGSVTAANAETILAISEVDGVLVGGASLEAATFIPIVAAAAR
ncbi:MAG TPA: triose-phosphate isomerase [Sphingomonas sp.]|uniref:triose-phosphate isomerase n=1 Tax=Sphingomonas sp. TaxID=28214 RepID=UPI002B97CD52|nr:triose-phosphate isomerase [Sphingomonas sp.]HMI19836.1 triose-phosphate isomerase [Sphingomonas sp.]